jgi:hypothetical protein
MAEEADRIDRRIVDESGKGSVATIKEVLGSMDETGNI